MTTLREARESLGLSQDQAAKLMGVNQSRFPPWESGAIRPRGDMLARLAKLSGLEVETITGLNPPRQTSPCRRPAPRAAREAAGLSVTALAKVAKVHSTSVHAWEIGALCPLRHTITAVAGVLGVEPETLDPACWKLHTTTAFPDKGGLMLRRLRLAQGLSQEAVA